ncbi:MAG: response regulator, partial [Verrucomicrobia bacterium]|nr:response regulator [Verrucomicrobiota bacterium]
MSEKKPSLLVVDDEKNTRDALRRVLEDSFEVFTTADVKGVRALLESESVDAVLTDLRLGNENGMQVVGSSVSYDFQVGADSGDTVSLTTQNIAASMAGVVAISTGGVSTADLASAAISDIDDALSQVNAYRGTLGALVNRLNYAADNLTNVSTNTAASRSRILDAD